MNYSVYKALNTLSAGAATFNSTISAVGTAITAVNPNHNATSVQDTLTQIMGAFNGWTNNLTTLGDGAWATAYPNITGTTAIGFTKTNGWKYVNANTAIPPATFRSDGGIEVVGSLADPVATPAKA